MNAKKRILSLALCAAAVFTLAACGGGQESAADSASPTGGEPAASPSGEASPQGSAPQGSAPQETGGESSQLDAVRFAVLAGPTGVGAAKLMADNEAGITQGRYEMTVAADNNEISAKLINGDLDVAAMASNVAANLYNKSEGGVQALCLSTLGVLYVLEGGEPGFTPTVGSLADLVGKTIYATGEGANPEYVLDYLLVQNGLNPDSDVEILWKTAEEVQAALLSGEAEYAMLPVPAATAAQLKSQGEDSTRQVEAVLDLTDEWSRVTDTGVLTMTTVVARTEYIEENPEEVAAFLADYAASIEYVNGNVEQAAQLVAQYGIVPSAAIAQQAIPDCNLVFITEEEMRDQIQGYYQVLAEANPASIGGGIPDDGFYYGLP